MGKKKIAEPSAALPEEKVLEKVSAGTSASAAKKSKKIQTGRVYIKCSYNNTIVSVTDMEGNLLTWATAGSLGFSGPKKATPFASSKVVAAITERIKATGPTDVEIIVSGVGSGRDAAIRSFINQGFNILSIRDVTPIPHNGPRPAKARRV